jgi:hypothetical protein
MPRAKRTAKDRPVVIAITSDQHCGSSRRPALSGLAKGFVGSVNWSSGNAPAAELSHRLGLVSLTEKVRINGVKQANYIRSFADVPKVLRGMVVGPCSVPARLPDKPHASFCEAEVKQSSVGICYRNNAVVLKPPANANLIKGNRPLAVNDSGDIGGFPIFHLANV